MYLSARSDASLRHPGAGVAGEAWLIFSPDVKIDDELVESFAANIYFGEQGCRHPEAAELAGVTAAAWLARSLTIHKKCKEIYKEYPLQRAILYTDSMAVASGRLRGRQLEFYRWEFQRQHGIPLEMQWLSRKDDWMQPPHEASREARNLSLSDGAEVGYISSREVPDLPLL